jgi:hypothetical protein
VRSESRRARAIIEPRMLRDAAVTESRARSSKSLVGRSAKCHTEINGFIKCDDISRK